MMTEYFTQTATWKQVTGTDGRGQPQFAPSQTIKVRWDMGRKLYRDAFEQIQVGSGICYCTQSVSAGDVLNDGTRDWPVLRVDPIVDLDGVLQYREVTV